MSESKKLVVTHSDTRVIHSFDVKLLLAGKSRDKLPDAAVLNVAATPHTLLAAPKAIHDPTLRKAVAGRTQAGDVAQLSTGFDCDLSYVVELRLTTVKYLRQELARPKPDLRLFYSSGTHSSGTLWLQLISYKEYDEFVLAVPLTDMKSNPNDCKYKEATIEFAKRLWGVLPYMTQLPVAHAAAGTSIPLNVPGSPTSGKTDKSGLCRLTRSVVDLRNRFITILDPRRLLFKPHSLPYLKDEKGKPVPGPRTKYPVPDPDFLPHLVLWCPVRWLAAPFDRDTVTTAMKKAGDMLKRAPFSHAASATVVYAKFRDPHVVVYHIPDGKEKIIKKCFARAIVNQAGRGDSVRLFNAWVAHLEHKWVADDDDDDAPVSPARK